LDGIGTNPRRFGNGDIAATTGNADIACTYWSLDDIGNIIPSPHVHAVVADDLVERVVDFLAVDGRDDVE